MSLFTFPLFLLGMTVPFAFAGNPATPWTALGALISLLLALGVETFRKNRRERER